MGGGVYKVLTTLHFCMYVCLYVMEMSGGSSPTFPSSPSPLCLWKGRRVYVKWRGGWSGVALRGLCDGCCVTHCTRSPRRLITKPSQVCVSMCVCVCVCVYVCVCVWVGLMVPTTKEICWSDVHFVSLRRTNTFVVYGRAYNSYQIHVDRFKKKS